MLKADALRSRSFWWFQGVGWAAFCILSISIVGPYLTQPGMLGYQSVKGLLWDQTVMCIGCFLACLPLRRVCRFLLQKSVSWVKLQLLAAIWSLLIGASLTLVIARLLVTSLEAMDISEACIKFSALMFLWCNLYFSLKRSQGLEQENVRVTRSEADAQEAHSIALRLSDADYRPRKQSGPGSLVDGAKLRSGNSERHKGYESRFVVRTGLRIQIVLVDDVEWIGAAGDYCELHTRTATHLLRETMTSLEQKLDPARFARIHRSRIVKLEMIRELQSIENREYFVKLCDGSCHRSSRTYADRMERWLRGKSNVQ